ncbi:hypothetical protein KAX17_03870 [Candidatus Bipolaricaulota bacterium]|nr:hypothetical protein [Candidatus Bipolaricaulota bacterium]
MNRRKMLVCLVAVALGLLVLAPASMAWKEGPGTNWWYINAQYVSDYVTGLLVIKLDGDSSAGQTFTVGDTVNITVELHAYAASCHGGADGAYTEWLLDVDGPTGYASDTGLDYDDDPWPYDKGCAEVETIRTLLISYPLTAAGTHTVYVNSYAAVSQHYNDVAEETVDALLTFEVVMPMLVIDGCDTGVQDQVLPDGSLMSGKIDDCAANARNHGQFVSCVAHLANEWKDAGYITGKEKGAIQSCAARADIP